MGQLAPCRAMSPLLGRVWLQCILFLSLTSSSSQVVAFTMGDIFKTAYYKLEKNVASKSIPLISNKDFLVITDEADKGRSGKGGKFDHSLWDSLLKECVSTGATFGDVKDSNAVDYASLAADSSKSERFSQYLELLAQAKVEDLSHREQLALWINAYNALCVSVILQAPDMSTMKSITEIKSKEHPVVWDLAAGTVGGVSLSLNEIEHEKLRNGFGIPDIHACIVCASARCPDLRREAYTGDRIMEQMREQKQRWVQNPTKGCSVVDGKLTLSRIFLWFQEDFGGLEGAKEFCAQNLQNEELKVLLKKKENGLLGDSVRYFEYNWEMNRAP